MHRRSTFIRPRFYVLFTGKPTFFYTASSPVMPVFSIRFKLAQIRIPGFVYRAWLKRQNR